jgi:hypothetical protein
VSKGEVRREGGSRGVSKMRSECGVTVGVCVCVSVWVSE